MVNKSYKVNNLEIEGPKCTESRYTEEDRNCLLKGSYAAKAMDDRGLIEDLTRGQIEIFLRKIEKTIGKA